MNKTYALRYSAIHNCLVVASELIHKKNKLSVKPIGCCIALLLSCLYADNALASTVNGQYDYQLYRDFAENKGIFAPGTTNINIYKRDNTSDVPDFILRPPMPDFSMVSDGGYTTLVAPSYIVSVTHNGGYNSVRFGGTGSYTLVARNNEGTIHKPDFHSPRLNKFVVEAAPANLLPFDIYTEGSRISDKNRFPIAVRLGSGAQIVNINNRKISVSTAYKYLTGGTLDKIWHGKKPFEWLTSGMNHDKSKVMNTDMEAGDSGSPLFIWDNDTQKWEVVGVLRNTNGINGGWSNVHLSFLQNVMKKDTDPEITLNGEQAVWGKESIKNDRNTWAWHGINETRRKLNDTRHLVFSGGGEIVLDHSVNHGAGGLFFDENQRYIFNGGSAISWQGAGIDIGKGTVVDWNIAGIKGDFLHKIGKGRLNVNEVNQGSLRLGDGVVALNTTSAAFREIILTSGRGTLLVNNVNSLNPSELYFHRRGGSLDLNGHDIQFRYIKATDNGANITNSGEKTATLTILPVADTEYAAINTWGKNITPGGKIGLLYEYQNKKTNTTDYFIQKKLKYSYFPNNQTDNKYWEFVGHDKQQAIDVVKARKIKEHHIFHGNVTGNIDLNTDSRQNDGDLVFDGNINIPQRTFTHTGTQLIFQGHPVIHAYNNLKVANILKGQGDLSVKTQPVSFDQPDWETRHFTLKNLILKDTHFHLSRNAVLSTNIQANHSDLVLGSDLLYINLKNGELKQAVYHQGTSVATDARHMSHYTGHIQLENQASLEIREMFSGVISASDSTISVISNKHDFHSDNISLTDSVLNITSKPQQDKVLYNSSIKQLTTINSNVSLLSENAQHHLTVDQLTASNSTFNFSTDLINNQYDRLVINTAATGANNKLLVNYFTDSTENAENKNLLSAASEQLIIHSDKSTTDDFFTLADVPENSLYHSGLAVNTTDKRKNWWLISMTDKAPWRLKDSRSFNHLDLSHGGSVQLSDATADNWKSHTLTVDSLKATGVNFNLSARLHTAESDSIHIRNQAIGDNNALNVSFLLSSNASLFDKDLLLASAPLDTPDSYFGVNPVTSGLTIFIPNDTVVEKDGKKQWLLMRNTPVSGTDQPDDNVTVNPPDKIDSAAESTDKVAEKPPEAADPVTEKSAEFANSAAATPQPGTALFRQLSLKLNDLDKVNRPYVEMLLQQSGISASPEQIGRYQQAIAHTAKMMRHVEILASVPHVSFVLETNQLNKRLGDVRQLAEDHGIWIKTSSGRGSYQNMNMRHNTLQLGLDKKTGNHLFGVMGSYTRGSSNGKEISERHTTAGTGLYYAWLPSQGVFVDVIGKYLRNYQHFTFPSDAAIASQHPRSTTLLGSVQTGYLAKFNDEKSFIEPSIELFVGHISGYRMDGRDIRVQMKTSNPLYSKIGFAAGYNWQLAPQRNIAISASLYRLQNLRRSASVEMIGSGNNNRRERQLYADNRYLISLSVNGRLSENWRIYSQLETSVGGYLKNDLSGQTGIRYQF